MVHNCFNTSPIGIQVLSNGIFIRRPSQSTAIVPLFMNIQRLKMGNSFLPLWLSYGANEEIQKRAFVWDGCTVKRVSHIAETVPVGTHPLTQLPSHFTKIQSEKGCGLVSEIKNGNRHFVMFVNTSPAEEWRVQIQTDDCVQLVRLDGTSVPAQAYDQLFILTPGNCDIFEVK